MKIAIIGAGSVGASLAYACLIQGVGHQIVLHDRNRAKVSAEVHDLNHGLQLVPQATAEGSDDISVCEDADIIAITAGAKQKPGQSRLDLAVANVEICRTLIPALQNVASRAILLLVTNPVDVLTYVAHKISGLPAQRILGSGTVLDSSRFRFLIAQRLRVAVANVHAYIAGEHGDSEFPLWSSASVGNVPLHEWSVQGHGKLTVRDRTEIFQNVKHAAQEIIAGKGATYYAIGLAGARILRALRDDENSILPVSTLMSGQYENVANVCLSVPCILNRGGVDAVLKVPLNDAERAGLANSAAT